MKKVLFSFLAVLFLFASCEGPAGPQGRPGVQGPPGAPGTGAIWFVEFIDVLPSDWRFNSDPVFGEHYLSYSFRVPELTEQIFDDGVVLIYLEWHDGSTLRQRLLPFSRPINEGGLLLTEYFDFNFSIGRIHLTYKITDFTYGWLPDRFTFKIVLLW